MSADHLHNEAAFCLVRLLLNTDFAALNRRLAIFDITGSSFEYGQQCLATFRTQSIYRVLGRTLIRILQWKAGSPFAAVFKEVWYL